MRVVHIIIVKLVKRENYFNIREEGTGSYNNVLIIAILLISPHFYFKYFHKLKVLEKPEPYYELKDLWTDSEIENLRSKCGGIRHPQPQCCKSGWVTYYVLPVLLI